jgi:hypothetical protein
MSPQGGLGAADFEGLRTGHRRGQMYNSCACRPEAGKKQSRNGKRGSRPNFPRVSNDRSFEAVVGRTARHCSAEPDFFGILVGVYQFNAGEENRTRLEHERLPHLDHGNRDESYPMN